MSTAKKHYRKPGPVLVVFIVFLILKVTDTINWSWWWVTSPLWIWAGALTAIFAVAGGLLGLAALIEGLEGKGRK
ncbi:hypothetical protein ACH47B_13295 [Rhodococcus sp. NPDC019627]|uniref:hypothetical protein n=1 Tax=unclassified Rhodococcus (in: high G+C Gram-positive bacteria) TaxID=192944 RepID=UPI003405803D